MALVVEYGLMDGGTDMAESYLGVADLSPIPSGFGGEKGGTVIGADSYWADFGNPTTWDSLTDAAKEQRLRQATRWLDANYRWRGVIAYADQVLDWPRSGVIDDEARTWDLDDGIPDAIRAATAEMAHYFALGEVETVIGRDRSVVEEQVGPVRVRYASEARTGLAAQGLGFNADSTRNTKAFAVVDGLLRPFSLRVSRNNRRTVRLG